MPSNEFKRIITDLQVLGDTCTIAVTKEGVRFSVTGDLGTGNVLVRSTNGVDKEEEEVRTQIVASLLALYKHTLTRRRFAPR